MGLGIAIASQGVSDLKQKSRSPFYLSFDFYLSFYYRLGTVLISVDIF